MIQKNAIQPHLSKPFHLCCAVVDTLANRLRDGGSAKVAAGVAGVAVRFLGAAAVAGLALAVVAVLEAVVVADLGAVVVARLRADVVAGLEIGAMNDLTVDAAIDCRDCSG